MFGRRLFIAGYITFVSLLVFQTCKARDNNVCAPSFCGKNNISYPFRLQSDPENCGDHNYILHCEKNTSTVLYLHSIKYYVQTINYNNYTIRVVDADVQTDNCSSLPRFSSTYYNFSYEEPYGFYEHSWQNWYPPSQIMILINCVNPVLNSPLYVDTAPCINNGVNSSNSSLSHSYVNIGGMITASDLMESCSLEKMMMLPDKDYMNMSFMEIHSELAYGFELSWYRIFCVSCWSDCYLDSENHVQCEVYSILELLVEIIKWEIPYALLYLSILLGLIHAIQMLCGTPCVIALLIYKWRRRHLSVYDTVEEFLQNHNNLMPVRYSYSDIRKITGGFKEKLGEGGFGCVYKGKLRSGHFAAIKMLGKSKANGQDFINEVATIGRIHHANVVQLIGFCAEGSKRALIYDFMSNGSLDSYIFSREDSVSLSWQQLYEISLGVAHGIEYLHRGCDMQILHFDIKPHNILLDANFIPKVSDFGLARLYPKNDSIASLTAARGTIGYMAPELFYKNIGRISHKADVYSFGMLLLEMAGKRKNLNALAEKSSQIYFPSWVYDQVSGGKVMEIGDATEEENKIVKKMILVGLWCIQMKPDDRTPMNKVAEMLEGDLENLQLPPKPLLCPEGKLRKDGGKLSSMSDASTESISLIENTC